jgi:copper ion binding protein
MFGKTVDFEFPVEGMSCGHCKAAVEKALNGVKGVKSAEADLAKKSVKVKAGESVSLDSLKEAVRGAGYKA